AGRDAGSAEVGDGELGGRDRGRDSYSRQGRGYGLAIEGCGDGKRDSTEGAVSGKGRGIGAVAIVGQVADGAVAKKAAARCAKAERQTAGRHRVVRMVPGS